MLYSRNSWHCHRIVHNPHRFWHTKNEWELGRDDLNVFYRNRRRLEEICHWNRICFNVSRTPNYPSSLSVTLSPISRAVKSISRPGISEQLVGMKVEGLLNVFVKKIDINGDTSSWNHWVHQYQLTLHDDMAREELLMIPANLHEEE